MTDLLAASLGLAALFAVWSPAFSVVKYAGALYLVYLGVQMLRSSPVENSNAFPASAPIKRVFLDGFVVALLNAKTRVFLAVFLPQLLSPDARPMIQGKALGSLYVAIAAVTDRPALLQRVRPRPRCVASLFATLAGVSMAAYSSGLVFSLRLQGRAVRNRPDRIRAGFQPASPDVRAESA